MLAFVTLPVEATTTTPPEVLRPYEEFRGIPLRTGPTHRVAFATGDGGNAVFSRRRYRDSLASTTAHSWTTSWPPILFSARETTSFGAPRPALGRTCRTMNSAPRVSAGLPQIWLTSTILKRDNRNLAGRESLVLAVVGLLPVTSALFALRKPGANRLRPSLDVGEGAFDSPLGPIVVPIAVDGLAASLPEIHEVEVERPIVVVRLPRSGTTHLVNLMAADHRRRALP